MIRIDRVSGRARNARCDRCLMVGRAWVVSRTMATSHAVCDACVMPEVRECIAEERNHPLQIRMQL